jgi:hypothetical protein
MAVEKTREYIPKYSGSKNRASIIVNNKAPTLLIIAEKRFQKEFVTILFFRLCCLAI